MRKLLLVILFFVCLNALAQNFNVDSIKFIVATSKGDKKIQSLIDLAWEYRFINADTARGYGLMGLDLAVKAKNPELEAYALHTIGSSQEAQGNYEEALEYELKALSIRRKLTDQLKTANTLNNIGIIYDERGDFTDALDYYHQARKIYEVANEQSKIAMVLNNIGIVLKEQKDFGQAADYYREALAIYKNLKKEFGVAASYANLGSVYFFLPQYDSSLHYSLLAVSEFERQNVKQFLPSSLCNAAMALNKMGKPKEAKEYLARALKLSEVYDNKKDRAFTLTYLSIISLQEGNLIAAEREATSALLIAIRINAKKEVMDAREQLSAIHVAKNDFKAALEEYKKFTSIKDTLFNQDKSKKIAELQTRYATQKNENKIILLQQENELKESRLQRNELWVSLLVIAIAALVLFGFLWRNRLMLKQKVELESTKATLRESQLQAVIGSQEEERKRFAEDLHDGMGQLISAVKLNLSKDDVEKNALNHAVEVLNEMNAEIRNIAFNLMPQVLIKGGLEEALTELAYRVNNTGKVQISISAFDLEEEMQSDRKVALYRVCQEWINNVIKYSACTKIEVQLVQHADELVITIEDDGHGFDSSLLAASTGNGWRNINSRLTLVHGQIEIDSSPSRQGTTVTISVPPLMASVAA